jgi:hypothetical protein
MLTTSSTMSGAADFTAVDFLATFFGRGLEIRRTRGAVPAVGSGEFSGEVVVSSLMLLEERSPPE